MKSLPTFRQLEHLVLLADHGQFGRAARACHVTQSTLSASIKELENVLQASLVDRTKRRVVLTPLGLEIVERARRILLKGQELVEAARAESQPLSGTLPHGRNPDRGSIFAAGHFAPTASRLSRTQALPRRRPDGAARRSAVPREAPNWAASACFRQPLS